MLVNPHKAIDLKCASCKSITKSTFRCPICGAFPLCTVHEREHQRGNHTKHELQGSEPQAEPLHHRGGAMVYQLIMPAGKPKKKKVNHQSKAMPPRYSHKTLGALQGILLDLGICGYAAPLRERSYRVYSACELLQSGVKIQYDYSLIRYAVEHQLLLITNDMENKNSCDENLIPCIYAHTAFKRDTTIYWLEKEMQTLFNTKPEIEGWLKCP